ncbi:hypothetical protein EI555_014117 [Monodon monoceros]|uniref:BTB domain-containing protein n=1 Tax=Monodon monoceros TaxID=40151 RepID=A0A4U1EZB6_MONMO|nr:hypothetical protein EI555_014117 [Monodon monoceros]
MAADIFRRRKPANSSSTTVHQYHQQNLSNNSLLPAPNWQVPYPTIRERNAVIFHKDLMADVHFVVGPPGGTQRLPGHKYVLAVGSSVFHAMFYGELAEDKAEICIPDVDPAAFLAMLKYIYCDEMDLAAVTVLATLYAAKKYIVPHLARACVNLLETCLSAKNACVLLSQSCLFEEPGLTQRCWEVIDAQAELALKSEGFCDIDFQTLEIRSLNSERDQRHLPLVHRGQEARAAKPARASSSSVATVSSCAPTGANQWRYRGRCDSIQFAVDKRVFIAGFGLHGSSYGSAEYSAKIELKRQGVVLGQNLSKYFSDGSSNTFPVWSEYPVQTKQDTFYTACVIPDGNELSYFGQEGMTEVQCGKVTVGTGVRGGGSRSPNLYSTLEHASRSSAGSEVHTTLLLA